MNKILAEVVSIMKSSKRDTPAANGGLVVSPNTSSDPLGNQLLIDLFGQLLCRLLRLWRRLPDSQWLAQADRGDRSARFPKARRAVMAYFPV